MAEDVHILPSSPSGGLLYGFIALAAIFSVKLCHDLRVRQILEFLLRADLLTPLFTIPSGLRRKPRVIYSESVPMDGWMLPGAVPGILKIRRWLDWDGLNYGSVGVCSSLRVNRGWGLTYGWDPGPPSAFSWLNISSSKLCHDLRVRQILEFLLRADLLTPLFTIPSGLRRKPRVIYSESVPMDGWMLPGAVPGILKIRRWLDWDGLNYGSVGVCSSLRVNRGWGLTYGWDPGPPSAFSWLNISSSKLCHDLRVRQILEFLLRADLLTPLFTIPSGLRRKPRVIYSESVPMDGWMLPGAVPGILKIRRWLDWDGLNHGSVGVCSSLRVNRGWGLPFGLEPVSWVVLGRLSMIMDIVFGVIETLFVGIDCFSCPLIWG